MPDLPDAALPDLRVAELGAGDAPLVQAFYDANPAYFVAVSGQPAQAGDGAENLASLPPAGFTWSRRWYLGWIDATGHLAAVADVTADLLAARVWHVGLFIVQTRRHGTGDAQALYAAIEHWARGHGARWMRLGVVQGNARAEAFWERCGYAQARMRTGVRFGEAVRDVRVMVKPLDGASIDEYVALVARDRPESP